MSAVGSGLCLSWLGSVLVLAWPGLLVLFCLFDFVFVFAQKIGDLANEESFQLYAACGRGPHSALRVLRHGLSIGEMAVSELPGNPVSVWTVKTSKVRGQHYLYSTPLHSLSSLTSCAVRVEGGGGRVEGGLRVERTNQNGCSRPTMLVSKKIVSLPPPPPEKKRNVSSD